MKRHFFLLTVLLLTSLSLFSQDKIAGLWLLTRAETPNGTQTPYITTQLSPGGKLSVMDIEMGTWKYDKGNRTLRFHSEMQSKSMQGPFTVEKADDSEMILSQKGIRLIYKRLDTGKVAEDNRRSPLPGSWDIRDPEATTVMRFTLPDAFAYATTAGGVTDTYNGTWLYDPATSEVILMSVNSDLRGKHPVTVRGDSITLVLEGGAVLKGKRENEKNKEEPEHLSFKYEDFPEESSEEGLPVSWKETEEMAETLAPLKMLVYRYGSWNPELKKMVLTYRLARLQVDRDKPSIRFTYLSVDHGDTTQVKERYKGGLTGMYNLFFPENEPGPFRVTGTEEISVPAGTYKCTVVEGFDGDTRIKYWMINDKPGIYARIIREETDPFGKTSYILEELEEIR